MMQGMPLLNGLRTQETKQQLNQVNTVSKKKETINMRDRKSIAVLLALAFLITLVTAVGALAQNASNARAVQVGQGQKQKIQGVVSIRSGDTFKVRDPGGSETTVLLTGSTDVTSHSKGLRGKKDYPVTYIMRGLRLQAQGVGDADGNLVAEW